jgi:hypothetical protein
MENAQALKIKASRGGRADFSMAWKKMMENLKMMKNFSVQVVCCF